MSLELRELTCYVAVAEELSFSRAAERLGVAQPPVSRTIQRLERRLGVRLLDRTTREVRLTGAGAELLDGARTALAAVAAAERRTRRAGTTAPRLVVAHKPGGDGGLLAPALAAYAAAADAAGLPPAEVLVSGAGGPETALLDGTADVGFVHGIHEPDGLAAERLAAEGWVVLLPAGHPLSSSDALTVAELAGERVARWTVPDRVRSAWPEPPGRPGPKVTDAVQLAEVVALGQAVAYLPDAAAAHATRGGMAAVPVTDLPPLGLYVAWPEDSRAKAVAAFVTAARTAAEALASE